MFTNQRILARLFVDDDEVSCGTIWPAAPPAGDSLPNGRATRSSWKGGSRRDRPKRAHPDGSNYLAMRGSSCAGHSSSLYGHGPGSGRGVGGLPARRVRVGSSRRRCAAGGGLEVHEYGGAVCSGRRRFLDHAHPQNLDALYAAGWIGPRRGCFVGEAGIDGGVSSGTIPNGLKSGSRGLEMSGTIGPTGPVRAAPCRAADARTLLGQVSAYDGPYHRRGAGGVAFAFITQRVATGLISFGH